MSYSEDFRIRVLEYMREGHTQAETQEVFKVGRTTIKEWKKLLSETGGLRPRELHRKARVYESEKLRTYIEEHPSNCGRNRKKVWRFYTWRDRCVKTEKISLKKRHQHIVNVMKKNGRNMMPKQSHFPKMRLLHT